MGEEIQEGREHILLFSHLVSSLFLASLLKGLDEGENMLDLDFKGKERDLSWCLVLHFLYFILQRYRNFVKKDLKGGMESSAGIFVHVRMVGQGQV